MSSDEENPDGPPCPNCTSPFPDPLEEGGEEKPKGLDPMDSQDPLKRSHGERVYTLDEFVESNEGVPLDDLINQRPKNMGLPGGPSMRYVLNPVDGNVMDMRHVFVVGYKYGGVVGFAIEVGQGMTKRTRPSSMDPQDFYSNKIGHNFFWYTGHRNESFMTRFSYYFKEVLGWKRGGGW